MRPVSYTHLDVYKRQRYRDLQSAFGDDYEGYVDHYISYGINEERDASPLRYKVDFVDNGQIVESQNVLCMRCV